MCSLINKSLCGFIFFCIFYLNLCNSQATTGPNHNKVVVCYFATWAVYRPGKGSFFVENIDPSLCTHLVYSFVGIEVTNDTIKSIDPWRDYSKNYGKDGLAKVVKLKQKYPHLKVTVAVGGWGEDSGHYSKLVADSSRREKLVASALEFVRKHKLDGLDIHWRYPAERGGAPEDKENLVLLVKELRQAFKPDNLLLTAAFAAVKHTVDRAYDVAELSKYLDYVHLMCFDYHGPWDEKIGVNAPLHSNDVYNTEYIVNFLIEMGQDPSKLVMGVPLYGRTFYLTEKPTPDQEIIGSPSKKIGFQGPYTKENDFLGYHEICLELQNETGWKKSYDAEYVTPYAVKDDKVIIYDDEKSITEKVTFAMGKKLGGIMVWSIDTEDFRGDCGSKYPLMRAINKAIALKAGEKKPQDNKNKFPLIDIFS